MNQLRKRSTAQPKLRMADESETRTERVCKAIREAIVRWELRPGEPLFEEALAEKLEVSRTPVREAFRTLRRENLIEIVPGRGAFVTHVSAKDLLELYQVRRVLEPLAAELAAGKDTFREDIEGLLQDFKNAEDMIEKGRLAEYDHLTNRMDRLISTMSGNQLLQRMLDDMWQQARRLRNLAYHSPSRLIETVQEHRDILKAILRGDSAVAGQMVTYHMNRSLAHAMTRLGMSPPSAVGQADGRLAVVRSVSPG